MTQDGSGHLGAALEALVVADRQAAADVLHAVDLCRRASLHAASLDGSDVGRQQRAERLERISALLAASLS